MLTRCIKQFNNQYLVDARATHDLCWQNMFVCTPPVKEIKVQCEYADGGHWSVQAGLWQFAGQRGEIIIRDETGVKLVDFMATVDEMIVRARIAKVMRHS